MVRASTKPASMPVGPQSCQPDTELCGNNADEVSSQNMYMNTTWFDEEGSRGGDVICKHEGS